jgi:hypothetical protein
MGGQVLAMTNLVEAYQKNDIAAFERILRTNKYAHLFLNHKALISSSEGLFFWPGLPVFF